LCDGSSYPSRRRRVLTCIKIANANAFHDLLQRTSIPSAHKIYDRTIDTFGLLH
jgi:hypothetical protein